MSKQVEELANEEHCNFNLHEVRWQNRMLVDGFQYLNYHCYNERGQGDKDEKISSFPDENYDYECDQTCNEQDCVMT